jgi:hypothetical protein
MQYGMMIPLTDIEQLDKILGSRVSEVVKATDNARCEYIGIVFENRFKEKTELLISEEGTVYIEVTE